MDNAEPDFQQQLREMVTNKLGLAKSSPLLDELKKASTINAEYLEKYEETVDSTEKIEGMEEVRKAYQALSEALETLATNEIERQQKDSAGQIIPTLIQTINHEGYYFYKSHQDLVVEIIDGGIIPHDKLKEVNQSLNSYNKS